MNIDEFKKVITNECGFDQFKVLTRHKVAILTDGPRIKALEDIAHKLSGTYDRRPLGTSSVGCVKVGDFTILAKPLSRQGNQSAGIENELFLIESIRKAIKECGGKLNVVFASGHKKFICRNVWDVVEVGRDTANRKKADIILKGDREYPISIKKDNAETWESADSFYSPKAKMILDDLIASDKNALEPHGSYYKVSKSFAVKATTDEKRDVVFGSDVENKGAVIKRTFATGDFSYLKDNTLSIEVSYLMTDISHVYGNQDVWFLVRNDKTRNTKGFYPGLRVLAVCESRLNNNVLRIGEDDE